MNNNNTNLHDDTQDEKIIKDPVIHAFVPPLEEQVVENGFLTEAEVEEQVGGDAPAEGVKNFNIEDEEAEKEEDPLLQ